MHRSIAASPSIWQPLARLDFAEVIAGFLLSIDIEKYSVLTTVHQVVYHIMVCGSPVSNFQLPVPRSSAIPIPSGRVRSHPMGKSCSSGHLSFWIDLAVMSNSSADVWYPCVYVAYVADVADVLADW